MSNFTLNGVEYVTKPSSSRLDRYEGCAFEHHPSCFSTPDCAGHIHVMAEEQPKEQYQGQLGTKFEFNGSEVIVREDIEGHIELECTVRFEGSEDPMVQVTMDNHQAYELAMCILGKIKVYDDQGSL